MTHIIPQSNKLRQQKFRKEHFAIQISRDHATLMESLQRKFSELSGGPVVSRNEVLTKALIETHAKYFPTAEENPNGTLTPAPQPETIPVSVNANVTEPPSLFPVEPDPIVPHKILTTSGTSRMGFREGLIWRDGCILKVRFMGDIDRRFKLMKRGFKLSTSQEGYVWFSPPFETEHALAGLATEVLSKLEAVSAA